MFDALRMAALSAMLKLPSSWMRRMVGPPIQHQDAQLDLLHQWFTFLASRFQPLDPPSLEQLAQQRREHELAAIFLAGPRPTNVKVEERSFQRDQHTLSLRIYRPPQHDGRALLYLHGGGWVKGSLQGQDGVCARLSAQSQSIVVAVGYRLAPEYRFPTALEDAVAAYEWVHDHAKELQINPTRLGIGGDSAGGNLAAAVSNLRKTQGLPLPKIQMLIYPVADVSQEAPSYELFGEGFFLTRAYMRWFIDHYVPSLEQRKDPRVSVLFEPDLKNAPNALVVTVEFDVLRDEGLAYVQRLKEAEVAVTHLHFKNLTHGSFNFAGRFPAAATAFEQIAEKMRILLES